MKNLLSPMRRLVAVPISIPISVLIWAGLTAHAASPFVIEDSAPVVAQSTVPLRLPELQKAVREQPAAAAATLGAAVERSPDNPVLLYDHAIAAYAAGHFDDALVSLDRVENLGNRDLARRAKFQKGNAEYRAGAAAREANLDETVYRWKQSLENYRGLLKEQPGDQRAKSNYLLVQKQLLALVLAEAKKNHEDSRRAADNPPRKLEFLRNAHDKYTEATQIDAQQEEAKTGEQETRHELAQELSEQGWQKVAAPLFYKPNPREPSLPEIDTRTLSEGLGMLQDAQELEPKNADVAQKLEKAKDRFADAQNEKARSYMAIEQNVAWVREKLALLRMAREIVEKALDQRPEHQKAQQTRDDINKRLAQIHEDEADQLNQLSDQSPNVEQQASQLSEALDHLQQAQELAPQKQSLPQKAQQTQEKLAQALEKMGDKLMNKPGTQESMEQAVSRLEGAQQAFDQLMGLKPSDQTKAKGEQVGKELEGLRGQMAEKGKQPGETPGDQPGPPMPSPGQLSQQGIPLDMRPRINQSGQNVGSRQSPEINSRKY